MTPQEAELIRSTSDIVSITSATISACIHHKTHAVSKEEIAKFYPAKNFEEIFEKVKNAALEQHTHPEKFDGIKYAIGLKKISEEGELISGCLIEDAVFYKG